MAQSDRLVGKALAEAEVVVEVDLALYPALLVLCLQEVLDFFSQLLVQQRERQRADGRHDSMRLVLAGSEDGSSLNGVPRDFSVT